MKISFSRPSLAIAVGSALLLTACGGGGSGTTGSTSGPPPSDSTTVTAVAINSANSKDVSAQVYYASQGLNNQVVTTPSLVTAVDTSGNSNSLLDTALRQIYFALEHQPASMAVGVTTTETVPCSGGGNATITANVADTSTVISGDRLAVNFGNCVEGMTKIDGTMDMLFNSITGTPSATSVWSAALGLTFSNFTVTESFTGVSNTATGDLALTYNQSSLNNASFSGSGNSLRMRILAGTSTTDYTLSAYNYSGSVTPPNLYTYRANFTLSGNFPRLGSTSYVVHTTTDFKQQRGAYPSQGVMTVTASDNSSLKFTVVDPTFVQLGLDKNGDATVDTTISTTWSELNALF